jgi:outer membrane protein assembly factor BamE (lipoprotein component of BamABCDE complex)
MGWMARALAAAGALLSLLACDPSGQVYEDLRLARLKPGESSEQDVRKLFGTPESVRTVGGGKGLVYPLGPEGAHTLLIKIGADGKYQGREDLLTRQNFGRIQPGQGQADVLAILGRPGREQEYKLKRETAWEWRFNDGAETRMFVVMFNAAGQVVSTAIEEDPRRTGGR